MKKTIFKAILCIYIIFCLTFFDERIGNEIINSLKLWSGMLIPALFPYLVLSQYITSSDVMNIFAPLKVILQRIFNVSSHSANVYLCSLVSGYPTGALCTSELYKDKKIEKEEGERLVCFTNNASPLFIISVVGTKMLKSDIDGLALYVIQCLSSAFIGIYLGLKSEKAENKSKYIKSTPKPLTDCTQNAINIMLTIGGYVIFASVLGEMAMISFEMIPCFSQKMLPGLKATIYFFLEISNSTKILSSFGSSRLIFSLVASAVSFSGLCVLMQIKSVLPKDFNMKKIFGVRILQAFLSFVLGFLYKSFGDFGKVVYGEKAILVSVWVSVFIFGLYLFESKRKKLSD